MVIAPCFKAGDDQDINSMAELLPFNSNWLNKLISAPNMSLQGAMGTSQYSARIAIPHYKTKVASHFKDILPNGLEQFCRDVEVPFNWTHFGVIIEFEESVELTLHNEQMDLNNGLRDIIASVGVVIIRNAYLDSSLRSQGHRNRFPHLNFHMDRSSKQPTHYSMYTRNPFDEEQKYPRTSSTLFTANIVGYLQGVREGIVDPAKDRGVRGTYTLFQNLDMNEVLDNIVLEHAWDLPLGTGELSMLDNIDSLHASYYRDPNQVGYKIGVRYLA